MKKRILGWDDFDQAVNRIVEICKGKSFSGVYGFPRGGLCLAVALSHKLKLPLLHCPKEGCLTVDDIYETGRTLNQVKKLRDARAVVWISKVKPDWWQAVEVDASSEWIVFPWEDEKAAAKDEQEYRAACQ